ncbi:MAG: hypothetical protein AAGG07_11095 [Planctomycetota bacterium]
MARRATPLFELLAEQTDRVPGDAPEEPSSRSAPSQPVARREPDRNAPPPVVTTRPPPVPAQDQTGPSASEHRTETETQAGARSELRIPLSWAYIGGAGALLLFLLVWTTGYHLGARDRERELADRFGARTAGGGIVEPLEVEELDRPLAEDTGRSAPARTQRPTASQGATPTGGRPGDALTPEGAASSDPREAGLNYLVLAQGLSFEEAQDAVRFLSEGGLRAVATPIDRSRRGSNNPVRYRLLVAQGFEGGGGKFAASKAERDRIRERAMQLGERWQRQGGSSSFPEPMWMKYQP